MHHRPSTALAQRAKPTHADSGDVTESGVSAEQRAAVRFMGDLPEQCAARDLLLVPTLAAAGLIGIKQQTLALWRCERQQDLPYVKMGRRVYYRFGVLQQFIESRTLRPVVQGG